MKKLILLFAFLLSITPLIAQDQIDSNDKRVTSVVDSSDSNNLVLIQNFDVHVPIDSVWNAYTTKRGWENAFVPLAEMDFKIGGTISTNYNKSGFIGDSTTITLHIINYVPQKILTLQAELTRNFPEFMQADAEDMYNIIYFEKIEESLTRVSSYGIGYKNNEKYLGLLKFFIQGNELSYLNLIAYLETGKSAKY